MMKTITMITAVLMLLTLAFVPVYSQTCSGFYLVDGPFIERGLGNQIEVPVWFYNNCPAGGMAIEFNIAPPYIIEFINVDFSGGPLENWDYLNSNLPGGDPSRLRVVAIANMDTSSHNPPLPPGNEVLIFTLRLRFACSYYTDTSAQISVNIDSTSISDSSGYNIFDFVSFNGGRVLIGDDMAIRGDANCNGQLIGSDVTYLINFFRGTGMCPCSRCAGDTNGDGNIIGSDVTYLVRYFTGQGNPPPPCGE